MELKSILDQIISELPVFTTEITLVVGSVLLLLSGIIFRKNWVVKIVYVTVLLAAIWSLQTVYGSYFNSFMVLHPLGYHIKVLLIMASLLMVLFSRRDHVTEFYFLVLAVLVGSIFMVQSNHFLLIYLGIELASYGSYLLSALKDSQKGTEAAFKYLLFGGVSSAIMLYGISLIYGDSPGLLLSETTMGTYSSIGMVLFLFGLLFKSSIVPFHLWVPGTYQAAPTDAVAFFSIVPKLAGLMIIFNFVNSIPILPDHWAFTLLIGLSVITILWGTLGAILQQNVKRLISYGAIAHSGFLLPLIVMNSEASRAGFLYYAVIYAVMNLGIFYMIHSLEEKKGENIKLGDLNGLGRRNGIAGAAMVILMLSLIGLPPTGGFIAKLLLFSNVWLSFTMEEGSLLMTLMIIGILSSVVSFFFYFRLPYHFFLKENEDQSFRFTKFSIAASTIFALCLLYFFIEGNIFDNFDMMSQTTVPNNP